MTPELREYYRELGKKRGKKLFEERGPEYFRKIAAMRKTHGRQKKKEENGQKES